MIFLQVSSSTLQYPHLSLTHCSVHFHIWKLTYGNVLVFSLQAFLLVTALSLRLLCYSLHHLSSCPHALWVPLRCHHLPGTGLCCWTVAHLYLLHPSSIEYKESDVRKLQIFLSFHQKDLSILRIHLCYSLPAIVKSDLEQSISSQLLLWSCSVVNS